MRLWGERRSDARPGESPHDCIFPRSIVPLQRYGAQVQKALLPRLRFGVRLKSLKCSHNPSCWASCLFASFSPVQSMLGMSRSNPGARAEGRETTRKNHTSNARRLHGHSPPLKVTSRRTDSTLYGLVVNAYCPTFKMARNKEPFKTCWFLLDRFSCNY